MSDEAGLVMAECLERFRRAHRRGMLAFKSQDADRFEVLGETIGEERRAIDHYFRALAKRREEFSTRREKSFLMSKSSRPELFTKGRPG